MVSVCLPSDALSTPTSYLGFSYLGRGASLNGCSSKAQPLLLTLEEGYLLTAAPPDLERGVAPLSRPAPTQQPLLGGGVSPLGRAPDLRGEVVPLGGRPRPRACGSSSPPPLLHCCSLALSVATLDLGRGIAPHGHASAWSCGPWQPVRFHKDSDLRILLILLHTGRNPRKKFNEIRSESFGSFNIINQPGGRDSPTKGKV